MSVFLIQVRPLVYVFLDYTLGDENIELFDDFLHTLEMDVSNRIDPEGKAKEITVCYSNGIRKIILVPVLHSLCLGLPDITVLLPFLARSFQTRIIQ